MPSFMQRALFVTMCILHVSFIEMWLMPSAHRPCSRSMRQLSLSVVEETQSNKQRQVAVIGGGWAGLSAVDSLATCPDVNVTLLDAGPVGGLAGGGSRSQQLQLPVEPGLHGFWREYRNTFATLERIGVLDTALTDYTPSILVSQNGRVALAPVLGQDDDSSSETQSLLEVASTIPRILMEQNNPAALTKLLSKLLPPPLDVALLSEFSSSKLTTVDRVSAVGLLRAWADFEQEGEDSWYRYDSLSAEALFRSSGVTPALYEELVAPLLHVLPMTTGYDCSAAAALSCFHVFALQSRGAFDVRWCRGSIGERIFAPWTHQLTERGNVSIQSGKRVTDLVETGSGGYRVTVNGDQVLHYDAVIMAVGGTAMKRLATTCPPLRALPEAKYWDESLRGVTCVAVRLFLKPDAPRLWQDAMSDSPVVVCGPNLLPELVETGFCLYDLNTLQPETFDDNKVLALEVDFFRADGVANLKDDQAVASVALRATEAALGLTTGALDAEGHLLEVNVIRARQAVSHFCPNSAKASPGVRSNNHRGLYFCGDWIDRTGHASWSTEKAVVTGRQAAHALAQDWNLAGCQTSVLPAAPDTPPLAALRRVARLYRAAGGR